MQKLNEGDPAPGFTAVDQYGKTIKLDDFSGKRLILYFYPKDNTPGCNAEACNLRDNHDLLLNKGYEVVGVSADNENAHLKFTDKFGLPFRLIPDTEKKIINDYGVWGPKKFMGREYEGIHRTTFIIDKNGIIEKIFTKVKTKEHTGQIIEAMK
ncbi:MAG: thioredoxin-dependent thiol peroxidase [Bacteroidota bacterium]